MAGKLKDWTGQAGMQWILGMLLTWLISTIGFGDLRQWLGATRWPLTVAVGAAAGLLVAQAVSPGRKGRRERSIYDSSYPECDPQYEILERVNRYTITESGDIEYARRYRVRAMKDGLSSYVDRFFWTGMDRDLKPQPGDHVAHVDISRDTTIGERTWFNIFFERRLNKGDEYEFEVRWPPMPDWACSRPFLSSSTNDPTYRIVFDVSIPQRFRRGRRAWFEVLRAVDEVVPFETVDCEFDDNGQLTVVRELPKLFHCYRLRWQWSPELDDARLR